MKTTFWDGKLQEDKLGGYVYALADPLDDSIFYVGLAGGLDGQGNKRPDGHLIETEKKIRTGEELSPKQVKIKEIWESGKEPKLIIVRRNLERNDAKHVEAALIDLFNHLQHEKCLILTNEQRGHWVKEHSIVTEHNLSELLAVPVQPESEIRNVWLFNIAKALKVKAAFEATIGDWSIKNQNQLKAKGYAVGLANGISKVVIEIQDWEERDGRKVIKGKAINDTEIGKQLFEKDFSCVIKGVGHWQKGGTLLVNFLPPNVEYIRGFKGGQRNLLPISQPAG